MKDDKNWPVVDALFKENSLVKHQIDSYNEFINHKIHKIIEEMKEVETNKEGCSLKFHKIRVEKPVTVEADGSKNTIFPIEARIRNKSYCGPLFLEISFFEDDHEKDREEVYVGDLPIMLRSDFCHLKGMSKEELVKTGEDPDDTGGYFIINGSEKVIVSVEDLAPNRIIVSKETKSGKTIVVGRIFSVHGGFRARVVVERSRDGITTIDFPSLPGTLPLFIVVKALGLDKDEDILSAFSERPEIKNEILLSLEGTEVKNAADAIDYIGKKVATGQPDQYRKSRAFFALDTYLLPHIGTTAEDRIKKAYFLAKMAERCMEVATNKRNEDDKDHYANKRIKVAGNLMEDLFRNALGFFIKDMKYQIERAYSRGRKLQIRTLVRPDSFNERVRFAMATGTWVGGRTGVAQLLDRTAHLATMSHLKRLNSPLSKSQPHFEARDLHPTQIFKICPLETPEGQNTGLHKNLSLAASISSRNISGLEDELKKMKVEKVE